MKYVPHCRWKNFVAMTMAVVTAGAWIPYAQVEVRTTDDGRDDDESFSVPPPIFESHVPPTWAQKQVPRPPVSLVKKHRKPPPVTVPTMHNPPPRTHPVVPPPIADRRNSIILAFLRAQLGEPYIWGGNGPYGWDCSGLTVGLYAKFGIHLPRTSQAQSLVGTRVSLAHLRIGDLLFWGSPGEAYHVAVYIGNGKFIGAQNLLVGVVTRSLANDPPSFARRIL